MTFEEIKAKQRKRNQLQKEADDHLIRSGRKSPAEVAEKNSIFSGVDLRSKRNEKGFDLF